MTSAILIVVIAILRNNFKFFVEGERVDVARAMLNIDAGE